jgi:3-hydroxypropanoate dehydrogenase
MAKLAETALAQLFTEARTRNGWSDQPIPEPVLRELYDLVKFGPTAANTTPARFIFVQSDEAKAKLAALSSGSNGPKILQGPGHGDRRLRPGLPRDPGQAVPQRPGRQELVRRPRGQGSRRAAQQLAAGRLLHPGGAGPGPGRRPMSGFDNAGVDAAFFAGTNIKSNFIASIGYGTEEGLFPRNPRLDFEEAAKIV